MDEGTRQILERAVVDVEPQRGLDDVKRRASQRHARGRLLAGITAAIVAIVGVGGIIAILNDGTPNPYIGVSASPSDMSQQASALQVKIDRARLELESLNLSLSRDLHRLSDAKRHGNLLEIQRVSARLRVERAEVARVEALIQHLDDRLHRLGIARSVSPSETLTGTPWTMAALTWQGKPIAPTAENSPTAFFEANGRLGGTFGCNSYSATFRTAEGGTISVRNWQQTLCYSGSEFGRAMMAVQRYRIDGQFLFAVGRSNDGDRFHQRCSDGAIRAHLIAHSFRSLRQQEFPSAFDERATVLVSGSGIGCIHDRGSSLRVAAGHFSMARRLHMAQRPARLGIQVRNDMSPINRAWEAHG
jgi:META domain